MIDITIYKTGNWKPFSRWNFEKWARKVSKDPGDRLLEELRVSAPVGKNGTGFLKDSLFKSTVISPSELMLSYGDTAPYFNAVVYGAKPHDIPNAFNWGPDRGTAQDSGNSNYNAYGGHFRSLGPFDGKFHPGIGNTAYGYDEANNFPVRVWATMGEQFKTRLAELIKEEFLP